MDMNALAAVKEINVFIKSRKETKYINTVRLCFVLAETI